MLSESCYPFLSQICKNWLLVQTDDSSKLQKLMNGGMEIQEITVSPQSNKSNFSINQIVFNESQLLYINYASAVRIKSEKLRSLYVFLPLSGGVTQTTKHHEYVVTPGKGLILSPGERMNMSWSKNSAAITIQIPLSTLKYYLSNYFLISTFNTIKFKEVFECHNTSTKPLCEIINKIITEIDDPSSLISRKITSHSIEKQLILTLIDTLNSNFSNATKQHNNLEPKYIKKAIAYIARNAQQEITLADLVSFSEVSSHTLQSGFQIHYGLEAMTYVHHYKLNKIRRILQTEDNNEIIISDVAAQWGFFHSSHFAKNYRSLFGESPSETLVQSH